MIRKYSGSRLVFITRVRRLVFVDSCSSLVAAPPPLAPNTRTIFVNSGARVRRLVFVDSLRLRLHSLRTLGQSSSIYLTVSFIILLSMSAVGIMNRKFLIACGADPKGQAQRAIKNLL